MLDSATAAMVASMAAGDIRPVREPGNPIPDRALAVAIDHDHSVTWDDIKSRLHLRGFIPV